MLSLGRLFANDYQDGTLEQLLLTPQPLFLVVLGKVLAQKIIAELESPAEPKLNHDTSTTNLIRRYRKAKS